MRPTVYRLLNRQEMEACRSDALKVHRGAFSQWPHQMTEEDLAEFGESFLGLADLPGFCCVAALDEPSDHLLGFALGWTSELGHWWRDTVEAALGPDCF